MTKKILESHISERSEDQCDIRCLIESELFVRGKVFRSELLNLVCEYYWNTFERAMPQRKIQGILDDMFNEKIVHLTYYNRQSYIEHTKKGNSSFSRVGGTS